MFKDIPGVKGYKINEYGETLPETEWWNNNKNGYQYIKLGSKWICRHRLVAELFAPNPENKPCVNHIDSNKHNNYYKNLEWVTHKENTQHAMNKGRINTNPQNFEKMHIKNCEITSKQIDQFDKQGNFIKTWPSLQEIERQTGMFATNISQTCRGKYKTHYGYIWRYHKTSND